MVESLGVPLGNKWNNFAINLALTLCMLGIFYDFFSSADFFSNHFFQYGSFRITISNQIWPDVLSGLICLDPNDFNKGYTSRRYLISSRQWAEV